MAGKFVSRAGKKLQFALDNFDFSVKGKVVADFGSSTGGFVDAMLRNGAKRVYSVDTAYGELDWNLRNNKRVIVMERTNAMHAKLPEKMDLITVDVGWTKQKKVVPSAVKNLKKSGRIISLIKPHYEAEKGFIKRGKLDETKIEAVISLVKNDIELSGCRIEKLVESPIQGARAQNREFLALLSCFK